MDEPFVDITPLTDVRLCSNCEYKDNQDNCPLLMKAPKTIPEMFGPYTAELARNDIHYEYSCLKHRFNAEEGDHPACKLSNYASCEACQREYPGIVGDPPCAP